MAIGERIRAARERAGLTLAELAEAIGKDKSVMSRIENGQRNVKSDELPALADRLNVTVDELMGIVPDRDLLAVAFRIGQASAAGGQQEAIRLVQDVLEIEQAATVGERRAQPRERIWWGKLPVETTDPDVLGEQAAKHVRTLGGYGDAPIADLSELAEDLGIDVLRAPLPGSVSGLCVRVDGGALIAIDSSPTMGHQRFTLAHEFGHFLLDDEAVDLVFDDGAYLGAPAPSEARANAFAYELLLPEAGLRRKVDGAELTEALFAELLFHFNVSQSALRHRLRRLALISHDRWRELGEPRYSPRRLAEWHGYFDEWARGHESRDRVVPPRRVWALARKAYQEGRIGLGLLATLRGQSRNELAEELLAEGISPDFSHLEAGSTSVTTVDA